MKKLISAILAAFILAVMAVPFSASAASGSAGLSGPGAIRAGNTITVSFVINGSGIEGAQGTINYDGSKLTLTGTTQKISSAWEVDFNGANFVAYDKQQNSPINGSSTLFSMTFNVNSGLPVGTSIGVSISGGKISDLNGGIDTNPGYSATLAAPLSTNNNLASMSIDGGTLSPAFDKNTTTYSTSVPFTVAQLNVTAKAEDGGASVSVNSPALTPGGTTAVTVRVTSANGDTKTYTINVARAQDPNYKPSTNNNLSGISLSAGILSPAFSADNTSYVVWLPYETDKIAVTATTEDAKAKYAVTGGDALVAGKDNTITVICTSESGAAKTYTVIAKRAAGNTPIDLTQVAKDIADAAKKGGSGIVSLDLSTSGSRQLDKSLFTTLESNKNVKLNINLGGATVTFAGSDITNPSASATYDLTYSAGSQYQDTIIKAVGDDSSAFTYSFGYHGNLPGYATFAISTNFTQGQVVNVYKYDPDKKQYVAIAQGVTVDAGGVVSYVNNTCSDYVITTNTIANAVKSAVLSKQPKRGGSSSFPFATVLIALATLIVGFAGGFFVNKFIKLKPLKS